MDYTLLRTNKELNAYLGGFEDKKPHVIALDIEAELNRHAYGERLCLVQINDGEKIMIIDPFNISNVTLKRLFESKNVLKVMYDASSDLSLMNNAYNIDIKSILDLRPAADILNYEARNLHSVIAAELGVVLTDKAKFQKHNWTRRPLDRRALEYAVNDVLYLLQLKDAILARLSAEEMMDMFFLKNLQVQNREYRRNPADRYRKVRGYHALTDEQKAAFRRMFDVREKYAKMTNMPSHNIFNNAGLIRIVQGEAELSELRFPRRLKADLVAKILRELKAGLSPGGEGSPKP